VTTHDIPSDRNVASTASPLTGIRVLELGENVAVPAAGRLLAGFGADVIKVERPGGDPARSFGPFPEGAAGPDSSGLFLWLNTGKRSLAVDYTTMAGRQLLVRLIGQCDLLMTSLPAWELAELGLDYDELAAGHESLAMVTVTSYGLSGPNRDYQATALTSFATGGQMWMTGDPYRPPVKNFGFQAEHQAGLHAFAAALTLLYQSLVTGRGDQAEISVQEAQASILEVNGPNAFNYGTESFRHGNVLRATWGVYPCRDGYVGIHVLDRNLPAFFRAMGREDLTQTYLSPAKRAEDNDLLEAIIYGWCGEHTEAEIFAAGVAAGAPIAYLPTMAELLEWPGLVEKKFWHYVEQPGAGPLPFPGSAITLNEAPFVIRPAPALGEHSAEVLAAAGLPPDEIAELLPGPASGQ
jgi:crotonobetainyl-CoA:carnitine CoA-transferase CaiB-like acyl-CoA transferase